MITASDKAIEKLREQLLRKNFEADIGFRVVINTDEFGKVGYGIKFDKQRQGDEVTELGGIKLFLDPGAAVQLRDHQIGYHDEPDGGFFLKKGEAKDG